MKPSAFSFRSRVCSGALFLLLPGLAVAALEAAVDEPGVTAATEAEVVVAWDLLDRMLYQDAAPVFDRLRAAPDAGPAVQLGHALSLLFRQPRTGSNLAAAEATLEALAAAADERWAPLARYYLARFDHVHAFAPNLSRAESRYRALWQDRPETELGQRAFVHAAVLAQQQPAAPAEKRGQLEALDQEATALTDPGLRQIYHLHAGEAWQRWLGEPRRAYAHYRQVAEAGLARIDDHANLLVRLGELAVSLDRSDEARRWYDEFLREYPRDARAHTVRQKHAALPPPQP